jgi:uncharacterized protein with HEPN domain
MATFKNPAVRLAHIRDELAWLRTCFDGMNYEEFARDLIYLRAAEYGILIVSDAVDALPDDMLTPYPRVGWQAIREMGDFLHHHYDIVDPKVVWSTLTVSLPELGPVIDDLLEKHGQAT